MNTTKLRKAAQAVHLIVDTEDAQDLSDKLNDAAHEIDRLRNELSVAECQLEAELKWRHDNSND